MEQLLGHPVYIFLGLLWAKDLPSYNVSTGKKLNITHGVVICGYNATGETPYWLIKNRQEDDELPNYSFVAPLCRSITLILVGLYT